MPAEPQNILVPEFKGATYRKCDFQIHTLRDAQWNGPFEPINDRAAFAISLVEDCRRRGINSVAITDHYDFLLWKTIYDAAQNEKLADGSLYPPAERLVVFPGVELTLSTPDCQAIAIFDSDIPENILDSVLIKLGIAQSNTALPKTAPTQSLATSFDFKTIQSTIECIVLNPEETNPHNQKSLKGKFIVLPHVTTRGHKSLLRDGFHSHYKCMPCIGGYIEGVLYENLGVGDRNVLEGKVYEWGNRRLAVFQTSDCRKAERLSTGEIRFNDLGNWPTWVKWARPSVEALRQACLASNSRILYKEPSYPILQIIGVGVSNTTFLGSMSLGLSPQFNAFIGGRGTGKSTLLEYIRWALCDEPINSADDDSDIPNYEVRRKSLVKNTLNNPNAGVVVYYKKNEAVYKIERKTGAFNGITVLTPSGIVQMSEEQVRREFPVVSYAQKQLSAVGTLPNEVKRLVTDPIKEELGKIKEEIEKNIFPKLREQRAREWRIQILKKQLSELGLSIQSKRDQIKALQSKLTSLTPEQRALLAAHEIIEKKKRILDQCLQKPTDISLILEEAKRQIISIGKLQLDDELIDLSLPVGNSSTYFDKVIQQIDLLLAEVVENAWLLAESNGKVVELRAAFKLHQEAYDKCISETANNKTQNEAIAKLNKDISDLEKQHLTLDSEYKSLQVTFDQVGDTHWRAFIEALKRRHDMLISRCELISQTSNNSFKARYNYCKNTVLIIEALERIVQNRNIRDSGSKIKALADLVVDQKEPILGWIGIVDELELLIQSKESPNLPETPLIKKSGFTEPNLISIRDGVTLDILEQNRFINIEDEIEFDFRVGVDGSGVEIYIPFKNASQGQQATCLLTTLLAQPGAPLLIDQPEEDLDNEQIYRLSEKIIEAKKSRELLFVSHNANIVVNGDAELVACFGYQSPTSSARGIIAAQGAIDCSDVRESITSIMEGGRDAFELRKSRYGF